MGQGATDEELDRAEGELGVEFPAPLREMLRRENGFEGWWGETFLILFGVSQVTGVNFEFGQDRLPGLLIFGSDGSRELIGFDLRRNPPPIVTADITSESWGDALFQAATLTDFMAQRERGEPFAWDVPYQ